MIGDISFTYVRGTCTNDRGKSAIQGTCTNDKGMSAFFTNVRGKFTNVGGYQLY